MSTHNILSVPVFDEAKKKFVGLLDVQDAVSLFLSLLRNNHNPSVEFAKATVEHTFSFVFLPSLPQLQSPTHFKDLSGIDVFMPTPKNRSLYHLIEVFTRGKKLDLYSLLSTTKTTPAHHIDARSSLMKEIEHFC